MDLAYYIPFTSNKLNRLILCPYFYWNVVIFRNPMLLFSSPLFLISSRPIFNALFISLSPLITIFYLLINSAISLAISSTVKFAVFRASLSAMEGEKLTTSCFVILCQIGSNTCSPLTTFVIMPSNS